MDKARALVLVVLAFALIVGVVMRSTGNNVTSDRNVAVMTTGTANK